MLDGHDHDTFLWNARLGAVKAWQWQPTTGPWWARLISTLEASKVSPSALEELAASSRVACSLLPNPNDWKAAEPFFSGVVVGSVQSGKTQNMMGLIARAFDNGYRVAIVLAGQTNDLRMQTARRLNGQLADYNERLAGAASQTTLGGSLGSRSQPAAYCQPYAADAHDNNLLPISLKREFSRGGKAILVIKKHPAALARVGEALRSALQATPGPVSVLVLDDECDDASVPGNAAETVVPDAIMGLLRSGNERLRFAYMGYTATAAANLLQDTKSPLYPNVVHLLRTPGAESTSLQYQEPNPDRWYCGSQTYFDDFGGAPGQAANFLVDISPTSDEVQGPPAANASLKDALRSYLMAGAFRVALRGGTTDFAHSMMVHTSQAMEDHRRYADAITGWFGGAKDARGIQFDASRLLKDVDEHASDWRRWYDRYNESIDRILDSRPHEEPTQPLAWERVLAALPAVFAAARLKVVNSDDDSADRLDYSRSYDAAGNAKPPPDQFVVVVGGARLSRGITIEGLTTSYFARDAAIRYEDALLQMNRWFGYRGPILEYCRVFTTPKAYGELRQMAENDELLRMQLYELMRKKADPREAGLVLRSSPYSKPTAKIGKGQEVSISFSPFVKVIGRAEKADPGRKNEETAAAFVKAVRSKAVREVKARTDQVLGIVSGPWTAAEAADWLDRLQFAGHNPKPHPELHGVTHRPLDTSRPAGTSFEVEADPYIMAAYLRAWSKDPTHAPPPVFNFAISYGSQPNDPPAFDFPLVNRQVTADGAMLGGWSGRNENWPGDIYFDLYADGLFPDSKLRAPGTPGLILLYLVHKTATGRSGEGQVREHHSPFLGLSIPAGGPQVWRTLTPGGKPNA